MLMPCIKKCFENILDGVYYASNIMSRFWCSAIDVLFQSFQRYFMISNLLGLHPFIQAAIGGVMIGFASWLLLASLGRVAGITGILGGALAPFSGAPKGERAWRWAFVVGLIGMGAITAFTLRTPTLATPRPFPLLILAGLLVGFGTVMGSGCTSGHGVCGIGRRSVRSIVSTVVFMTAGFVTVTLVKLFAA
jgi:uncharacterized protein